MIFENTPEKAAALVAGIEARLAAAQLAAESARAAHAEQAVAVELGDIEPDARSVRSARVAVAAAEDRAAELRLALTAARKRHQSAVEAADASERTRRWDEVEKLAQRAHEEAAEVDRHIAATLAARDKLTGTLSQIHGVAPQKDAEIAHSRLSRSAAVDAVRMSLFRQGELWAWRSWLGDPTKAPSVEQRVSDATRTILDLRDDGK